MYMYIYICKFFKKEKKNCYTLLDLSVSSLRRGHANLLCIVPILADDLRGGPDKLTQITL